MSRTESVIKLLALLLFVAVLIFIFNKSQDDSYDHLYEIVILDGNDKRVIRGIYYIEETPGAIKARDLENNEYRLSGNIKIIRKD